MDMRQKDNDGNSLLNHVCAHGTPRMVELVGKCMAARGVECDQRNNLGYTALLLSIKHDRCLFDHITILCTRQFSNLWLFKATKCIDSYEIVSKCIGYYSRLGEVYECY